MSSKLSDRPCDPHVMSGTSDKQMVGGVSLFSTVDWPDMIAATIFLKGCPWRCTYCHNLHLLEGKPSPTDIAWDEVIAQLERRQRFLDGVIFSGGEPLVTAALPEMITTVKEMGFAIGLHTNGIDADRLSRLLAKRDAQGDPIIDWVGLDIKAPFHRYEEITRKKGSGTATRESLLALRDAGVSYELRTTLYPEVFDKETLIALGEELAQLGEKKWMLQRCRDIQSLRELPLMFDIEEVCHTHLEPLFLEVGIR